MIQFPQPTRPTDSYNFETPQLPSEPVNMNFEPQIAAGAGGGGEEEKETLDELLKLISEWYEKLPASIRSQLKLRMMKGPSNKLKGFKVDSTTTRGVNGPLDDMKRKLERFKIRTVQQGGVVQVDEEASQQQQQ